MPTMMGHQVFGGSKVNIAACGSEHTVITTTDGEVWTWGLGIFGRLGHGGIPDGRLSNDCCWAAECSPMMTLVMWPADGTTLVARCVYY